MRKSLAGFVMVGALLASACGGGSSISTPQVTGTLNGSGATFPQAFYQDAIASFKTTQPGVTITYGGGGLSMFKMLDFVLVG